MTENMTENAIEPSAEGIGTLLKAQREKSGYSLQDAAEHTRIRRTYLESIESNQFSDLPGQVYVTGFIRVYARYLGLDSDLLLQQLEKTEVSDKRKPLKAVTSSGQPFKYSSRPFRARRWSVLTYVLLAVLLFAGAASFLYIKFLNKPPAAEIVAPVELERTPEPGQGGALEEAVQVPQESVLSVPQEEQVPVVVEVKAPQKSPLPTILPAGSSLRMLALVESSLTVSLDDRTPQRYKLHGGLDLSWRVKKKAVVELLESGAARFWLDGQELNIEGLKTFQLQPGSVE